MIGLYTIKITVSVTMVLVFFSSLIVAFFKRYHYSIRTSKASFQFQLEAPCVVCLYFWLTVLYVYRTILLLWKGSSINIKFRKQICLTLFYSLSLLRNKIDQLLSNFLGCFWRLNTTSICKFFLSTYIYWLSSHTNLIFCT